MEVKNPTPFSNTQPLSEKKITAEVCVHHLWFSEEDYPEKGTLIKWNPAVKKASDREALWKALNEDKIDILATDHAPHTLEEKQNPYTKAPSGGPLVQHAYPALLTAVKQGKTSLEKAVNEIKKNSRRYAKRQITWFKKYDNALCFPSNTPIKEVVELLTEE